MKEDRDEKGQAGYQILAPVTGRFASTNPADPDSWRRLNRGEKPKPGEVVRSRDTGDLCESTTTQHPRSLLS